DDGTMARMDDLIKFSEKHDIRIVSVVDLIKYRLRTERFIRNTEVLPFESEFGSFNLHVYESQLDGAHHLAIVKGDIGGDEPVLLRVHTESLLGDTFASRQCGPGSELRSSLEMIEKEGRGVLVYLKAKEREQQFLREVAAHRKGSEEGVEHSSFKDYGIGAQIIADLGLHRVRLLTNHPKRLVGLEGFDINIVEQIPIGTAGKVKVAG
ncbi:MAG: bifunctional 3,4-dihydroxy-2-butanone-4-phosphate synthase/GTP cyclohydrolase II, partial [Acidobacteriota bacterium]